MNVIATIVLTALGFLLWTAPDRRDEYQAAANIESRAREGERIERLARQHCGDNAGWALSKDGKRIHCTTKHGRARGSVEIYK